MFGNSGTGGTSASTSGGSRNVAAIVLSVLLVGAIACGVAFAYRWRWSKSGRDTSFVAEKAMAFPAGAGTTNGAGPNNTTPSVDVGPEKDLDGNELENVEII